MDGAFGLWLKQRRRSLGMSQQDLAQQVGCSAALIRKLESGERRTSRQIAELLAHSLNVRDEERSEFLQFARGRQVSTPTQTFSIAAAHVLSPLTRREREILRLMAADLSNDEIAERLYVRVGTVRWYVKQIYGKLGVHNRDEALIHAETGRMRSTIEVPADLPSLSHNLPASTTVLVGRQAEIAAIHTMLAQFRLRLLTLVGAAGIGKTRLSLEAAAACISLFSDGVFFVPLASLADPTLVPNAIAQTLGLPDAGGQSVLDVLKAYLRGKTLLLVLDNFEHLLSAAPVVAGLLSSAHKLKILATSREALRIYGEHEYPVPPLGLHPLQSEDQSQSDSVMLFIQRAIAARPDLKLTPKNVRTIADICARLDGLPLAIELAAARIKLYPPEELHKRLNNRLNILTGGARDLPERHQTLRAALTWSYDLLDSGEQRLFARLGIFVGGWTLETMAAICADDLPIDVYNGLESLLHKSLVQQSSDDDGDLRFMMLETIREYALERLVEMGEETTIRQRHAAYFLALVEHAEPQLRKAGHIAWFTLLRAEYGNLRAILHRFSSELGESKNPVDDETAVRIAASLWYFWSTEGRYHEGIHLLEHALTIRHTLSPSLQTRVLNAIGVLEHFIEHWEHGAELCTQALKLAQEVGDQWVTAHMLIRLGRVHTHNRDFPLARTCLDQSLHLAKVLNDNWLISFSLQNLGICLRQEAHSSTSRQIMEQGLAYIADSGLTLEIGMFYHEMGRTALTAGELDEARSLNEQGIIYLRRTQNRLLVANALRHRGDIERFRGAFDLAKTAYEESLTIWRDVGDKAREAHLLHCLGYVTYHQENIATAEALFKQSLIIALPENDFRGPATALAGLAKVGAYQGRLYRAAVLLSAADSHLQRVGRSLEWLTYAELAEFAPLLDMLKHELGSPAFEAAWAEGAELPLPRAVTYALETMSVGE